jgi:hypothetical protein
MAIERLKNDLDALKRVNSGIHKQSVIEWFNEQDIDYFRMSDLEMYIYYIENANEEE